MRKIWVLGGVAALVGSGALVALRDSGGDQETAARAQNTSGASALYSADMADSAELSAGATASGGGASAAKTAPLAAAQPRVVKTAELTLSVGAKSVGRIADRVANAATEHGGYVEKTERHDSDADASANVTLRVPATAYDATLAQLRGLGSVANESLGGRDVTGTLVDLDARIRSLRAQENALNALLGRANTVGETLQVAQAAGEVRTQIEQLAAQQAQLSDQADFATISVRIVGPGVAVDPTPDPEPLLVSSAKRAVGATLAVFGGMLVVLGYFIPLALLAALGFGGWRLVSRRRLTGLGPTPAEA